MNHRPNAVAVRTIAVNPAGISALKGVLIPQDRAFIEYPVWPSTLKSLVVGLTYFR
jgi:hypothetical protein